MNEVDIERQRLYVRMSATWLAIFAGIVISLYFLIQLIEFAFETDLKLVLISIIGSVIAFKIRPYIDNFYEKRLMESKKRNHTL